MCLDVFSRDDQIDTAEEEGGDWERVKTANGESVQTQPIDNCRADRESRNIDEIVIVFAC
jgi:hypothetical protein